jgi:hypothetical protein
MGVQVRQVVQFPVESMKGLSCDQGFRPDVALH